MKSGTATESLAESLYSALIRDLPDIHYDYRRYGKDKDGNDYPMEKRRRRPCEEDVEVFHFPQAWGSTSLGFGGLGGAAITTAYTTVVKCNLDVAVYFSGRSAYILNKPEPSFYEDLYRHRLVPCRLAGAYMIADKAKEA